MRAAEFFAKTGGCPAVLFALCWLWMPAGHAQTTLKHPDKLVHYSHATLLGTGYYTVGNRRVAVLRVPLGYGMHKTGGPTEPVQGAKP